MSHPVTHKTALEHSIHDRAIVDPLPEWLFDPHSLADRSLIHATSRGRRNVWFFRLNDQELVLRHYWRGGMISRWSSDVYVWTGLQRTRAFAEWRLLTALVARGLPAPTPVAARVRRYPPGYRADLVTRAIAGARPFDEWLQQASEVSPAIWYQVGQTIGRFHAVGACHADLNVRNILLDDHNRPWLIDWDRGRLRAPGHRWQQARLTRLRRSFRRHAALDEHARRGWPELQSGHRDGLSSPPITHREAEQ